MLAATPAPPSAAQPKTGAGLNKPHFLLMFRHGRGWERRERSSDRSRLHTPWGTPRAPLRTASAVGLGDADRGSLLHFLTMRSQCYSKNARFAFQHPAAESSQGGGTQDGCKHKFLGTHPVNRWTSRKEDWDYFNHLQHDKIKIRIPHKTENNAQPFGAACLGQSWRKVYLGCGLT